jgi:hypothetical protein
MGLGRSSTTMSYGAQSGMAIYRSRLHQGLKRNFQRETHEPAIRHLTSPDLHGQTPLSRGGDGKVIATLLRLL